MAITILVVYLCSVMSRPGAVCILTAIRAISLPMLYFGLEDNVGSKLINVTLPLRQGNNACNGSNASFTCLIYIGDGYSIRQADPCLISYNIRKI